MDKVLFYWQSDVVCVEQTRYRAVRSVISAAEVPIQGTAVTASVLLVVLDH